ncbi:hypothetical protein LTR09_005507 [Extremus antarcticus]|uniref:Translational machinery component n=1 Tax=Extremus antarcticus TaxID=702011 RepID=A0AAJ0DG92_9PEZI|nr:hypothetical protein LTR09_005507 [Extremus antarcticus]
MAASTPARAVSSFICHSCRAQLRTQPHRPFSTTTRALADSPDEALADIFGDIKNIGSKNPRIANMRNSPQAQYQARRTPGSSPPGSTGSALFDALDAPNTGLGSLLPDEAIRNLNAGPQASHRLHVFATKHNTHLTLVQPPRAASETASLRIAGAKQSATEGKKIVDTLISLSTGNIGFKKAGRGSFDAAFQLAAFVLRQMGEKGMTNEIRELEVVLRGFGAGREAVTKALLGTEGRGVRGKVRAVVDATRLKQGGPRSKKPRRLG